MRPLHISADPDLRTIRVREAGQPTWVEFRANLPYHLWGEVLSHAAMLHDALEGWHACILHAGDSFTLLERHPDYARVAALVRVMDRERLPFVVNGRVME